MRQIAEAAFQYLQENLLSTVLIAFVAGFAGVKTVAFAKKGNPALFLVVGLLGAFAGQFAIRYLGLEEILNQVPSFRLLFDFLAAYAGSFVIAALLNFVKPQ